MESASRLGLHHLARMGMPGESDRRAALLRVLTELYVQKPAHTADEERHYTELALRLLDKADSGSRIAVAQLLAHYRAPPRRVVEHLAGEISTTRNGEVASRPPIGIEIASELNELFFTANPEERRLILMNLDVIAPFPAKRKERSREDGLSARLEAAVLSRNREAFAQDLAQALQISRAQARRIADDDLGEPIVTAAKALNIRRRSLYRILLFVNIGRSVARVQALTELHHELSVEAAEQMAAIWRALPKVDRATERHQPVLWEGKSTTGVRRESAMKNHPLLAAPQRRDAS
jgi:hypothetical protein